MKKPEPFLGKMGCLIEDPPADAMEFPARVARIAPRGVLQLKTPTPDQLDLGSCVAQTYKKLLEILSGISIRLSALGIYVDVREFSGFPIDQDSGAYPEAAVRALVARGAGSTVIWPYDTARFDQRPPDEYYAQAADHKVLAWFRARTVAQAKAALDAGYGVGSAFDVPPEFDQVGVDGMWRDGGGPAVGGHMTAIVAWDDEKVVKGYGPGAFYSLNWWSILAGWGAAVPGHSGLGRCGFWIPYEVYEPGARFKDAIVVSTFDAYPGGPPPVEARPEASSPKPKVKRRARKKKAPPPEE